MQCSSTLDPTSSSFLRKAISPKLPACSRSIDWNLRTSAGGGTHCPGRGLPIVALSTVTNHSSGSGSTVLGRLSGSWIPPSGSITPYLSYIVLHSHMHTKSLCEPAAAYDKPTHRTSSVASTSSAKLYQSYWVCLVSAYRTILIHLLGMPCSVMAPSDLSHTRPRPHGPFSANAACSCLTTGMQFRRQTYETRLTRPRQHQFALIKPVADPRVFVIFSVALCWCSCANTPTEHVSAQTVRH